MHETINVVKKKEFFREAIFWENLKHDYAIWHFVRYKKISDLAEGLEGRDVLDIGCGIGLMDALIQKKRIVGIDVSRSDIREAKRIAKAINPKAHELCFVLGDLHFLPFSKRFDIIICSEVLEHLNEVYPALESILATLKESGFLILTLPNALRIEVPQLLRLRKRMKYPSHIREYSMKDLAFLRLFPLRIEKRIGVYLDFPFFHVFSFPLSLVFNIPEHLSRSSGFSMKYRFSVLKVLYRIYARFWAILDMEFENYTYFIVLVLRKLPGMS